MHGIKENSNTLRVIGFLMNGMFLLIAYLICFDEKFIWFDSILNLDFKNGNFYRKCCTTNPTVGDLLYNRCLSVGKLYNRFLSAWWAGRRDPDVPITDHSHTIRPITDPEAPLRLLWGCSEAAVGPSGAAVGPSGAAVGLSGAGVGLSGAGSHLAAQG